MRTSELRAELEDLASFGSPIDLNVLRTVSINVEIALVGGACDSKLFELENGQTGFMADLQIINQTSKGLHVLGVEVGLPWDDSELTWLTPIRIVNQNRSKRVTATYSLYRFPGKCGLELPCDEVINPALLERRRLPAKRALEGWLLGMGGRWCPRLRHGQRIDVPMTIITADRSECRVDLDLWVEPLNHRSAIMQPGQTVTRELFGAPPKAGTRIRQGKMPKGLTV